MLTIGVRLICDCVSRRTCALESGRASFSRSSVVHKQRKIFYNKYIEDIRRKKRVYTGYAEDILKAQSERAESEYEDYQEELLAEGRKRQHAYIHFKRMRVVQKGAGPRLLTFQQMEQIRFLKQTDPEEWDNHSLAHAFQVPERVITKVLKSKVIPKPGTQEKLDNKARANHRISLPSTDASYRAESALMVSQDSQQVVEKNQWGLPEWQNLGWFSGYDRAASTSNTKESKQHDKPSESGVQWLDDEECQFYEDLYQSAKEVDGSDDEDQADSQSEQHSFGVSTDDGRTFYDDDDVMGQSCHGEGDTCAAMLWEDGWCHQILCSKSNVSGIRIGEQSCHYQHQSHLYNMLTS